MVQMALQEVLCNGMKTDNTVTTNTQNESPSYEKSNDKRETDGIEKEEKIEVEKDTNTVTVLPPLFTKDNDIEKDVMGKDTLSAVPNDYNSILDESTDLFNSPILTMTENKDNDENSACTALPTKLDKETNLEHECLLQPTHHSLLNKLEASKNTIATLEETITRLEKQLTEESSKSEKLRQLEFAIIQYEKEIQLSKQEHEIDQRTIESLKKEMETKLAALKKQFETANKEKENMVMRYAVSEKELLDCKKEKDNLDRKMKDIIKDNESSLTKLKTLTTEKNKISQLLENKVSETSNAYKEIDKLKEEINSRDIKIKWTQNKLKSEIEGHKECPVVIETLNSNIKHLEKELDTCKEELNIIKLKLEQENNFRQQGKIIAENPEFDEVLAINKSLVIENQVLTEEQSLINKQAQGIEQIWVAIDTNSINEEDISNTINLSKKEVLTNLLKEAEQILTDVSNLRSVNGKMFSQISKFYSKSVELLNLSPEVLATKIQGIQSKPLLDKTTNELESSNGDNNILMPQLISRIHYLEHQLAEQRKNKEEIVQNETRIDQILNEFDNLRLTNEELTADIAACKDREAELLSFTEKLTTKNVKLQSDYTAVESKVNELEITERHHAQLESQMKQENEVLQRSLADEKDRRQEETRLLARQVAEKTTKVEHLLEDITTLQSELSLVKNKHIVQVKELQRELSHYRRKVEQLESNATTSVVGSAANSLTTSCSKSTTSSSSSLNDSPVLQGIDVPAQVLVERIVKLQQESAKQNDRIEFLEEHSTQLVRELQKKSRLLQNYIMREQTGTLTSNQMDRSKAELSKTGGIMASLYGSKPADETMTFELCLEINRKLQAVLEDTLLKNITLKENIDTLGDEIARLTQQKS